MWKLKSQWVRALRGALLLVLAAVVFLKTTTLLWAPLLLAALFFFAVDIFSIDKSENALGTHMFEGPMPRFAPPS